MPSDLEKLTDEELREAEQRLYDDEVCRRGYVV